MGYTKCAYWCVEKTQPFGFVPPIDLVYSTRLSCSDCKQNKLRKDEVEKFKQVYFDLL